MALQDLILETDKRINNINEDKIIVRQSEKGLVLTATILKPDGTKYDLSNHKVQFGESKDGDKIVIDEDVEIDSSSQGVIHYTMNKAVYAASGEAWFEIFDSNNNVIDTTQNFYVQVMPQATIHITNDNYVSSLQAEINHFKANNQHFITVANQELDSLKSQIQQSKELTEKSKQDALNAIQEAKDTATTTLNNLNDQYSSYASKYAALESKINSDIKSINDNADSQINSIKADWDKEKQAAESDRATIRQNGTDEINSIKSDWSEQTNAINMDAKTKIDAAIAAVETVRDNAIKQAVSDFSSQRDNLQADYNSWKQDTVNDFNSQLATLQGKIDSETKQQSDLKAAIDSARAAVDKISDVDFTKFAHKEDVDQALKSIDFGKIGIKENYLNPSTNVAQRTIFPVKQSDGNWIFDRASDDATAETAKEALEQVLQNGKTLNHLSDQFNTKADKDDVDKALKSIDFGKIAFRKQYTTDQSGSKSYKTWSAKKQTDGTWLIDLSNDDWTAATASDALGIVESNKDKISQLNTRFDKYAGNQVAKNADANTITTSGTYYVVNPGNNFPIDNWGELVVHQAIADGNIKIEQTYYPDDNSSPWFRIKTTGIWKSWRQLASQDNISDLQNQINNLDNKYSGYDSRIGNLERKIDGLTPFTIITQAQYDKLTEAQKQSGTYGISG